MNHLQPISRFRVSALCRPVYRVRRPDPRPGASHAGDAAPGSPPNSDIMFGGPGDDVNLWAPGDGSETFVGGPGLDAIIFGSTDREAVADPATGVRLPTLRVGIPGFPQGVPTADVSGLANFCTLERRPTAARDGLSTGCGVLRWRTRREADTRHMCCWVRTGSLSSPLSSSAEC